DDYRARFVAVRIARRPSRAGHGPGLRSRRFDASCGRKHGTSGAFEHGWPRRPIASEAGGSMQVKGGRLELLVPHMLRGQLLRPGFVRLSLRLGLRRQMPAWAKLQFTNNGITPEDLDSVLGRITSLESWVDEWESLGRAHEQAGHDALKLGKRA